MMIDLSSWDEFKLLLQNLKNPYYYYIEDSSSYTLFLCANQLVWTLRILKGTTDAEEFEIDYKNNANTQRGLLVSLSQGDKVVGVESQRLLVDTGLYGYTSYFTHANPNLRIPISQAYTILSISNQSGAIDEIHINLESDRFYIRFHVDETLVFNMKLRDILNTYGLSNSAFCIFTSTGTDFHSLEEISFTSQCVIDIINLEENNRRLLSYFIKYRVTRNV